MLHQSTLCTTCIWQTHGVQDNTGLATYNAGVACTDKQQTIRAERKKHLESSTQRTDVPSKAPVARIQWKSTTKQKHAINKRRLKLSKNFEEPEAHWPRKWDTANGQYCSLGESSDIFEYITGKEWFWSLVEKMVSYWVLLLTRIFR